MALSPSEIGLLSLCESAMSWLIAKHPSVADAELGWGDGEGPEQELKGKVPRLGAEAGRTLFYDKPCYVAYIHLGHMYGRFCCALGPHTVVPRGYSWQPYQMLEIEPG